MLVGEGLEGGPGTGRNDLAAFNPPPTGRIGVSRTAITVAMSTCCVTLLLLPLALALRVLLEHDCNSRFGDFTFFSRF